MLVIWFRVALSSLRFIQAMRCSIKCLFVTEEINERERTTAIIYVDDRQYYTVSRQASNQGSYAKLHATGVPNS